MRNLKYVISLNKDFVDGVLTDALGETPMDINGSPVPPTYASYKQQVIYIRPYYIFLAGNTSDTVKWE